VAALTECNPFVPERIELMERILGPAKRRNFIDPNSKVPNSKFQNPDTGRRCSLSPPARTDRGRMMRIPEIRKFNHRGHRGKSTEGKRRLRTWFAGPGFGAGRWYA